MKSASCFNEANREISSFNSISCLKFYSTPLLKMGIGNFRPALKSPASNYPPLKLNGSPESSLRSMNGRNSQNVEDEEEEDDEEGPQAPVEDLKIPDHWLEPSKALEESEWLRVALHKWLDEEYCPEETNVEISEVAAKSYYKSLVEKKADLGEILLKMAVELESISYQESFHGAFSSANAAVNLILQRIDNA